MHYKCMESKCCLTVSKYFFLLFACADIDAFFTLNFSLFMHSFHCLMNGTVKLN